MALKETKRKAFNFLRSYYDVYNQLEKDSDKLSFLESILNKQFLNENPKGLEFVPNLCYESQRHAIESSVKGWLRANNTDIMTNPPTDPPTNPPTIPKEEEEKEEVKEEEKGKEEVKEKQRVVFPFDSENFKKNWYLWKDYKQKEFKFKYKSIQGEQAALMSLNRLADQNEEKAIAIINQSFENGWKGFFELKTQTNGKQIGGSSTDEELAEAVRRSIARDRV